MVHKLIMKQLIRHHICNLVQCQLFFNYLHSIIKVFFYKIKKFPLNQQDTFIANTFTHASNDCKLFAHVGIYDIQFMALCICCDWLRHGIFSIWSEKIKYNWYEWTLSLNLKKNNIITFFYDLNWKFQTFLFFILKVNKLIII